MSKGSSNKNKKGYPLSRRRFLQVSGVAGAGVFGASIGKGNAVTHQPLAEKPLNLPIPETEIKKSVCHQCPGRCGIDVYVTDGKVHRIFGSPEHPISNGKLCPKGYFGLQILYDPDRFKSPMKRTNPNKGRNEDPKFVPIIWDEALDTIAKRLKILREKGEAHRFALLLGRGWGASDVGTIETFGKLYGSPNVPIGHASICSEGSKRAKLALDGNDSYSAYDWDNCNYVLSFGAGLLEAFRPYNYIIQKWGKLRDKAPRARITQIDVRMSTTAVAADRAVIIKPGTDGALALAISHVILTEGLWDKKFAGDFKDKVNRFKTGETIDAKLFAEKWVSGLIDWWNLELKDRTPKWAAEICRISPDVIVNIAREFATALPSIALFERGATTYTNGVYNGMAIHSLNALVGGMFAKGGLMYQMKPPYGPLPANADDYMDSFAKAAKMPRIDMAGTDQWPLAKTMLQEVSKNHIAGKPYKLDTVMFCLTNPLFSAPDSKKWEEALKDVFVIDTSPFPGETAMFADIVIPDHTYLERHQDTPIYPTYGYPTTNLRTPVIPPLYDTKYVGDTIIEIGKRMGGRTAEYFNAIKDSVNVLKHLAKGFEKEVGDNGVKDFKGWEEKGFWAKKPYLWKQIDGEFLGWDGRDYNKKMSQNDVKEKLLKTPSGKFELKSQLLIKHGEYISKKHGIAADRVGFPQWVAPKYTGAGDLHLIVPKYAFHAEGRGANLPISIEQFQPYVGGRKGTYLEMHSETAKARGIKEEDTVKITTPLGSIEAKVRYYDGCQKDVVVLPFEFGHFAMGRWAKGRGSGNSNEIIENVSDPISGLASFNSSLCKVEKI
ncbi:MAG: molybdopterin-dependent oxidoreductase [Deltaproteobacteria bacterium]|nr:molybdopterin-dependent oxidoreductase [Deltaproteobacteria bacterium]